MVMMFPLACERWGLRLMHVGSELIDFLFLIIKSTPEHAL